MSAPSSISTSSTSFEFSKDQDVLFQRAAYWMGIMGRLGILFGCMSIVLAGAAGIMTKSILGVHLSGLIGGVVGILVGIWTCMAARAFGRVASTAGHDVENVVTAVGNLTKLYQLQAVLIAIAAALLIAIEVFFGVLFLEA